VVDKSTVTNYIILWKNLGTGWQILKPQCCREGLFCTYITSNNNKQNLIVSWCLQCAPKTIHCIILNTFIELWGFSRRKQCGYHNYLYLDKSYFLLCISRKAVMPTDIYIYICIRISIIHHIGIIHNIPFVLWTVSSS
jgi:hypothetical protein